jgi:hypothetical protein
MGWNPAEIDSEILAVHAALVPNGPDGEVVLFGGDEHWGAQQESAANDSWKKTRVYDVRTHSLVAGQVQSPASDVFCAHHVFIGDGRLLIAGGTSEWPVSDDGHNHGLDFPGHSRCWLYNPRARQWIETARLNRNPSQPDEARSGGRWYPGLVAMGDGSAIAFFGHLDRNDTRHRNTIPERYFPSRGAWLHLPQAIGKPGTPDSGGRRYLFFPRAYVLPNGKIFSATPLPFDFAAQASGSDGPHHSTSFDAETGTYATPRAANPDGVHGGWDLPAVLLPLLPSDGRYNSRALYWEGTQPRWIDVDAASPDWTNTGARVALVAGRNRRFCNMVLLPTGQVCVVGGVHVTDPEDPVDQAEIFTPDINWATNQYGPGNGVWTLGAGNAIQTRNYHSTALLLPNGKVWVAGSSIDAHAGDPATTGIRKIELFEPDYVAVAGRIAIQSAPPYLPYGREFDVVIDQAAVNVQRVAVIRNSSVTHSTDNDQRYVGLEIVARTGNTLRLRAPPNGNVAPPGYYMLWVIDTAGNPCQIARFVRLGHVFGRVILNRSTFSQEEVAATGGGGTATFVRALYVDYDGFRDTELTGFPAFALTFAGGGAVPANQVRLEFAARYTEASPPHPDIPTRITYAYHVIFETLDAYTGWLDRRDIDVRFTHGGLECGARIKLSKSPNPFMLDVDPDGTNPFWLSTDVRVFKMRPGETNFGATFPAAPGGDAPYTFIRSAIDRLRSGMLSFNAFPIELEDAVLDGAYLSGMPPRATFNFAVAKVRYRATTTIAQNVRCFFRMCNAATTGLEFNTSTVYRSTSAPNPVPLLGIAGGQLVSIPFTNEPRINTVTGQPGAAALTGQLLNTTYDIQNITPNSGGAEVTAYFGVYLDINQPVKRFPLNPVGDGPYAESDSQPIRDLLRSWHNCLVAEIWLDVDPTEPGSAPSNSDNLSQRNLAIVGLENPGLAASRTAMHTFEVSPSKALKGETFLNPKAASISTFSLAAARSARLPDELLFDWHNLPRDAEVTIYFSDLNTTDLAALLDSRIAPPSFAILDEHTVRFKIGDCGWLPLPGGRVVRIPALLAIKLPIGIIEGQVYKASVHQVDGRSNLIVGSFTLEMPVSRAEFLLPEAKRQLSFLKHILTKLDLTDRWRPLFEKWVMHLHGRVDALGGDSGRVHPNPDGSGEPYRPSTWTPGDPFPSGGFHSGADGQDPCKEDSKTLANCSLWPLLVIALATFVLGVVIGIGSGGFGFVIASIAVLAAGGVAIHLLRAPKRCALCRFLQGVLLGSFLALATLGLAAGIASIPIRPAGFWFAGGVGVVAFVSGLLARCFSGGKDC